jgi:hypothetical protein
MKVKHVRKCKKCDGIITSPKWWKSVFCSRKCFFENRKGTRIHDKEELKRMSERTKKLWLNPVYRKRLSDAHKGQIAWNKGKKTSSEVIDKLRKSHLGKVMSEITRQRMSDSHKGLNTGDKNGSWNNGSSFLPYSTLWTKELREEVRRRDGYICMICKTLKAKGKNNIFHVHHIDYNKKNCDLINLITLCHTCHMKTHHKRDYWKQYFANLILKIQGNDIVRPTTINKIVETDRNVQFSRKGK